MGERWTLSRAGILNVYQYSDEVLDFAGGRLLLRGVNGSGKSTAMNMLLPFLLDGDTRKIDAAGEQSGVLRSWMLSGRDDPQPIGYLWVEFARGGEHLTCGCGIKASRSTDNVAIWWWVTSRRVRVDLDLVQDRRPLSAEALRAVLSPDPVFRQEDRRLYREEVRRRLYGGADIEQHIRLLHTVRSPRVGDRIDLELASHLNDSLPQLSEAALLDAAQPLDDLDEHRRNVGDLTRTEAALSGLKDVYGDYARADLRRRAASALSRAEVAEVATRAINRAEAALRKAEEAQAAAAALVSRLEAEEGRLGAEIQALRDAPAYREGAQMEDLRHRVADLAQAVERAQADLAGRRRDLELARADLATTSRAARDDHALLGDLLADLSSEMLASGVPTTSPDRPSLEVTALDDGLSCPAPFPNEALNSRLSDVRAAANHRRGDVAEVRTTLRQVAASEQRLAVAAETLAAAESDLTAAQEAMAARAGELDLAVAAWRQALVGWYERLAHDLAQAGQRVNPAIDMTDGLADRRTEVHAALRSEG